jgi:LmbE family N-acetylglucosaminyl deacetylase
MPDTLETIETPERALVVTPHPDDAEIGCAGTISRWVNEGVEVYYVLCTDGGKGSSDPNADPQSIAAIREKEQRAAADLLGVKDVVMLGYPDGDLEDSYEFRKDIVRAIRRFRPDTVLCPDPYRRNFYWHRDHRITGQVSIDASFPYARDRLHFLELWESEGLEPYKTGMCLLWGAEEPNAFVDITDTMNTKIDAMMCHRSQVGDRPNLDVGRFLRESARVSGETAGCEYAEGFRMLRFRR